jgi:hypothetical protein
MAKIVQAAEIYSRDHGTYSSQLELGDMLEELAGFNNLDFIL